MSKIREKEPLECGRMYIWALKIQKLPGPTSLHQQLSVSEAGPPPLDQNLDPHLRFDCICDFLKKIIWRT